MYSFGKRSQSKLASCDDKIQQIMNEVIKHIDISIISGHRGEVEQDELYSQGFSKVQYPNSKHNSFPSMACDVMLWNSEKHHIRWNDKTQQSFVAGYIRAVADKLGISIRQGVDFDGDMDLTNQWWDGPHMELKDD